MPVVRLNSRETRTINRFQPFALAGAHLVDYMRRTSRIIGEDRHERYNGIQREVVQVVTRGLGGAKGFVYTYSRRRWPQRPGGEENAWSPPMMLLCETKSTKSWRAEISPWFPFLRGALKYAFWPVSPAGRSHIQAI